MPKLRKPYLCFLYGYIENIFRGRGGGYRVCQMDAKSPAVPWRSLTVLAGFFIGMHLSRECRHAAWMHGRRRSRKKAYLQKPSVHKRLFIKGKTRVLWTRVFFSNLLRREMSQPRKGGGGPGNNDAKGRGSWAQLIIFLKNCQPFSRRLLMTNTRSCHTYTNTINIPSPSLSEANGLWIWRSVSQTWLIEQQHPL